MHKGVTSQAAKANGFTLQEETRMSAETGVSDTRGDEIDELKQKNINCFRRKRVSMKQAKENKKGGSEMEQESI